MKKRNTIAVCCTDGIRPVVFGTERIDGCDTRITSYPQSGGMNPYRAQNSFRS